MHINNDFQKNSNISHILEALWYSNKNNLSVSRIDLSKNLDLYRSTVGNVIQTLLDNKVILEGPARNDKDKSGRNPITLSINPEFGCIIGIELQTDFYNACICNFDGSFLFSTKGITPKYSEDSPEINFSRILKSILDLIYPEVKKLQLPLLCISVGIPGIIDTDNGIIISSEPFGLKNFPYPVELINDYTSNSNYTNYSTNYSVPFVSSENQLQDFDLNTVCSVPNVSDSQNDTVYSVPNVSDSQNDTVYSVPFVPLLFENDARCCSWYIKSEKISKTEQDYLCVLTKNHDTRGISVGISLTLYGKVISGHNHAVGEYISNTWTPAKNSQNGLAKAVLATLNTMEDSYREWIKDLFSTITTFIPLLEPQTVYLFGQDNNKKDLIKDVIDKDVVQFKVIMERCGSELKIMDNNDFIIAKGAALMFVQKLFEIPSLNDSRSISKLTWDEVFKIQKQ